MSKKLKTATNSSKVATTHLWNSSEF